MNWCMRTALILALSLTLWLAGSDSSFGQRKYKAEELVGQPAPPIKGEMPDGKPKSLDDFKGKVVLVDFWAIWCGPCIATFPHLREWHEKYHDQGLVIFGATRYFKNYSFANGKLVRAATPLSPAQERDMLKDFLAHHKLKHTIVVVGTEDTQAFKLEAWPTAVLIDRKGIVRLVRIGSGETNAKAIESEIKKLLEEK